jgi:pimeloyl-ACP methyl ester carboxylesterase
MAGLHAEALTRLQPNLVAGLVLVDGSVEFAPRRPSTTLLFQRVARSARRAMRVTALRPLGSLSDRILTASQSSRRFLDSATPEARKIYRDPEAIASVVAEQAAYGQQVWDLAELRRSHTWPAVPTVVLTAGGAGSRKWVEEQHRLAQLLGARQVVAKGSRHLMMIDAPQLIADVTLAVRAQRTSGDVSE